MHGVLFEQKRIESASEDVNAQIRIAKIMGHDDYPLAGPVALIDLR